MVKGDGEEGRKDRRAPAPPDVAPHRQLLQWRRWWWFAQRQPGGRAGGGEGDRHDAPPARAAGSTRAGGGEGGEGTAAQREARAARRPPVRMGAAPSPAAGGKVYFWRASRWQPAAPHRRDGATAAGTLSPSSPPDSQATVTIPAPPRSPQRRCGRQANAASLPHRPRT